jgi:dTDP-4-amino-4,6-dideoxygalactose transaminase
MKLLKGLFSHVRLHRKPQDMPPWVRKRLYDNLLHLMEEEQEMQRLLQLPIKPRLCIVDEERVVMIRPYNRSQLNLDEQMRRAREEKQSQGREK